MRVGHAQSGGVRRPLQQPLLDHAFQYGRPELRALEHLGTGLRTEHLAHAVLLFAQPPVEIALQDLLARHLGDMRFTATHLEVALHAEECKREDQQGQDDLGDPLLLVNEIVHGTLREKKGERWFALLDLGSPRDFTREIPGRGQHSGWRSGRDSNPRPPA